MTIHRFHAPGAAPGVAELPETAHHHATHVLRLSPGSALRVFDEGREFAATISSIDKHRVRIEVGEALTPPPERAVALHLVMSPLKSDLTELVIQKATELGVARICPVIFERTDTVARRDPSGARAERWQRVAVSASEQSGRAVVPMIEKVASLASFTQALGAPTSSELRFVATEPSLERGREERRTSPDLTSIIVAIGPAGGLASSDLATLEAANFTPARFALHTLRSETACIAALAILADRYL